MSDGVSDRSKLVVTNIDVEELASSCRRRSPSTQIGNDNYLPR
jgi:hypothetical protein